jgi:hypothetical protein
MDERLRLIEKDVRDIRGDVTKIREKIFNGFERTVNEIHKEVVEMRKLQATVEEIKIRDEEEFRLATCPLKKSIQKNIERKFYLVISLATLFMSIVTIVANILLGG